MLDDVSSQGLLIGFILLCQDGNGDVAAKTVFEKRWQEVKEPLSFMPQQKFLLVVTGVEIGRWKVLIIIPIGKRGGVQEALYLYDTSEEHVLNRLKFAGINDSLMENLVDLDGIRRYKAAAHKLSREEVATYIRDTVFPELIKAIEEDVAKYEGQIKNILMSNSVSTGHVFSGGGWGQGRQS